MKAIVNTKYGSSYARRILSAFQPRVFADAIYDRKNVREGLCAMLATEPGLERVG